MKVSSRYGKVGIGVESLYSNGLCVVKNRLGEGKKTSIATKGISISMSVYIRPQLFFSRLPLYFPQAIRGFQTGLTHPPPSHEYIPPYQLPFPPFFQTYTAPPNPAANARYHVLLAPPSNVV